ncbi:MAG TPA: valine--tRNA ligase, partial [Clostridium sp.]|nr:valine--tRNA ligase [Clostridium sp.]
IPFDTVLINSIVKDSEGRKMSKSLGNGIDPLDVIDEYGADALRFMLITGNSPGNDIRFRAEKIEAARNFANKIWNASRFVMMNIDKDIMNKYKDCKNYTIADKWILSRLNDLIKEIADNMEKYELGIASQKIYDFMWTEFCDWYIELVKPIFSSDDIEAKGVAYNVLNTVLTTGLQLFHPVMPYITEEIYTHLEAEYESITISKWPEYSEEQSFKDAEEKMIYIIEAVKAVRNIRTEMKVPSSRKVKLMVLAASEAKGVFEKGIMYFEKLTSVSEVEFLVSKEQIPEDVVSAVTKGAEIHLPLLDLVDVEKELERLNKKKEKLKSEIDRVEKKLSNEKFVAKAPQAIVDEEKAKGEKYKEMLKAIVDRIEGLK